MSQLLLAELVLTFCTAFCTALAVLSTRRAARVRDECERMITALRAKLVRVAEIDEELHALDVRIRKLNGRITARRGAFAEPEAGAPPFAEREPVDGDWNPGPIDINAIVNGQRPR